MLGLQCFILSTVPIMISLFLTILYLRKKPKKISRSLKYENNTTDKENCAPNTAPQHESQHEPQPPLQSLSQPYPGLADPDLDDSLFITSVSWDPVTSYLTLNMLAYIQVTSWQCLQSTGSIF